jgi:hypothetical protein
MPFPNIKNSTYANLVAGPSFPYYDLNLAAGGVLVQMSFDQININR